MINMNINNMNLTFIWKRKMECLNNAFKINGRRRKSKKKFISFFDFKRFLLEINISLIELILCVEIIRCERANSRDSKLVSQRARVWTANAPNDLAVAVYPVFGSPNVFLLRIIYWRSHKHHNHNHKRAVNFISSTSNDCSNRFFSDILFGFESFGISANKSSQLK